MIAAAQRKILWPLLFRPLVVCLLACIVPNVRADLSPKQARKLITRAAGFELTTAAVRIKSITPAGNGATEVSAEIQAVFKFEKNSEDSWQVAEIRTGPDRWEDLTLVAKAFGAAAHSAGCNAPDPPFRGALAVDPSVKRARCLLADLLAVELPSDAVRIQEVASLPIPLAPQPSATVVSWIRVDARLMRGNKGWFVESVRTGTHHWVELEPLLARLRAEKQKKARADLEKISKALEQFRTERGFYVISEKHSVVIDYLSPNYLSRVIRFDPWHQPYRYKGQRDHFTISSSGPDGKDDTADDIILASQSR